jgi:hypothetical protein
VRNLETLRDCHDCGARPGQPHNPGCDTERCSVCGGQRLQCECAGHDPLFARWTGLWPGSAEARSMGMDLNDFAATGTSQFFFVKPKGRVPVDPHDAIRAEVIEGLSDADIAIYDRWARGEHIDWRGVFDNNPAAYGAIMETISKGLG